MTKPVPLRESGISLSAMTSPRSSCLPLENRSRISSRSARRWSWPSPGCGVGGGWSSREPRSAPRSSPRRASSAWWREAVSTVPCGSPGVEATSSSRRICASPTRFPCASTPWMRRPRSPVGVLESELATANAHQRRPKPSLGWAGCPDGLVPLRRQTSEHRLIHRGRRIGLRRPGRMQTARGPLHASKYSTTSQVGRRAPDQSSPSMPTTTRTTESPSLP